MMIILNLLFLVFVQYCASDDRSPFDWNLKTMEHGSDYADNSKLPTFDKNEFPKKFFHTSDKTNDENNIFEKLFYKEKYNKYEWKPNDGNFKKKSDYNERNPFYFSSKPFTKNVPDFTDNEFPKKSFHSSDRTYNEDNIFDKILFRKMDNKEEWKTNSGNFKKNFDFNEKNSFSFNRKPFINDENRHEQYKTNSFIFSQNTDNDRRYPGANNYGDYEDKNGNDFGSNFKYNYYKEPKIHKDININHYDKDDKDFRDFNITNNQNQDKRIDLHQDNKGYSFLPFFSQRIKNFTSNIVCDKYNQKNKDKGTQKEGQTESPKDEQKENEKDNEKPNNNGKDNEKPNNNGKENEKPNNNGKDNEKPNNNGKENEKDNLKENGKDIEKNDQKVDTAAVSNCSGKYEDIDGFVGTNLIDNTVKRCFSTEEVALLSARRDFEVSVLVY